MISKISYIKLIREDIRHRGWLAALSGVLLFLSMPVYTLIYLDSYSEDPEVLKEFADTFSGFINGYNSAFLIHTDRNSRFRSRNKRVSVHA